MEKQNSNFDFDLISHLVVLSYAIEGHIDSVGGTETTLYKNQILFASSILEVPVVMWSKERLLVRPIANHEVHQGPW